MPESKEKPEGFDRWDVDGSFAKKFGKPAEKAQKESEVSKQQAEQNKKKAEQDLNVVNETLKQIANPTELSTNPQQEQRESTPDKNREQRTYETEVERDGEISAEVIEEVLITKDVTVFNQKTQQNETQKDLVAREMNGQRMTFEGMGKNPRDITDFMVENKGSMYPVDRFRLQQYVVEGEDGLLGEAFSISFADVPGTHWYNAAGYPIRDRKTGNINVERFRGRRAA